MLTFGKRALCRQRSANRLLGSLSAATATQLRVTAPALCRQRIVNRLWGSLSAATATQVRIAAPALCRQLGANRLLGSFSAATATQLRVTAPALCRQRSPNRLWGSLSAATATQSRVTAPAWCRQRSANRLWGSLSLKSSHQRQHQRHLHSSPPLQAGTAMTTCSSRSAALRFALEHRPEIFDSQELTAAPVALLYDLDTWDTMLESCKNAFPPNFRHFIAAKANPVLRMLGHAHARGFGVECASIGELLLAHESLGLVNSDVIFDSPAKTALELEYAIRSSIRCHVDNFAEFERVLNILGPETNAPRKLGFRVNPSSVGEGQIAALSVSTPDSKFGVDVSDPEARARLLRVYADFPFLDSVHVHVGSGGMEPQTQLAVGIRSALDLALEINQRRPSHPIQAIDIGGGLPVNYISDDMHSPSAPSFEAYAAVLAKHCPELFDGRFQVITEFGQSLNAKAGFLASRVEFVKRGSRRSSDLAVVHFGADLCLRQAYANVGHARRFECFAKEDAEPLQPGTRSWSIGGPLCFQGDFVGKDLVGHLPDDLQPGDLLIMKDAGANTLSMFSRHCSRFAPPVYGFRWHDPYTKTRIKDFVLLKPRETLRALSVFWRGSDDSRRDVTSKLLLA